MANYSLSSEEVQKCISKALKIPVSQIYVKHEYDGTTYEILEELQTPKCVSKLQKEMKKEATQ